VGDGERRGVAPHALEDPVCGVRGHPLDRGDRSILRRWTGLAEFKREIGGPLQSDTQGVEPRPQVGGGRRDADADRVEKSVWHAVQVRNSRSAARGGWPRSYEGPYPRSNPQGSEAVPSSDSVD